MLTAEQIDMFANPILDLHEEYINAVIQDIARRLKKIGSISFTSAWQLQRVTESGAVFENAIRELAKLTGKTEAELKILFQKAGVKTLRFDDEIYRRAGLKPLPLNLSPAMAQTLAAGLQRTQGLMRNLTQTTALASQQAFIKAGDLAYQKIVTGAFDYNSAIRAAVKQVAADGIETIDYASGHHDQLDVATRRAVLTGVAQTANQLQINRAEEVGSDLVAVSAHAGARNKGVGPANHASWQGKVYSRSGKSKKYPDFREVTGYGTGEGLGGWNCRHSFYPFFEGISEPAQTRAEVRDLNQQKRTYQDERVDLYELTQKQRYIERQIRLWKRQAGALEAAGLEHAEETAKVSEWQAAMRSFVNQTRLSRQYPREQVQ